jgi:hypothetical protein
MRTNYILIYYVCVQTFSRQSAVMRTLTVVVVMLLDRIHKKIKLTFLFLKFLKVILIYKAYHGPPPPMGFSFFKFNLSLVQQHLSINCLTNNLIAKYFSTHIIISRVKMFIDIFYII